MVVEASTLISYMTPPLEDYVIAVYHVF